MSLEEKESRRERIDRKDGEDEGAENGIKRKS